MFTRWTSHYVNLITCGLYIGLPLVVVCCRDQLNVSTILLLLVGLILLALVAFAFNLWRYLHISKAPISTIASAAQGYVELNGVASTTSEMQSPLHNIPCVWYRAWTYARGHENFWRLVNYMQSDDIFQLQDESGACTVNPKGAEVIHMLKKTSHQHNHRYVEEYLPANKSLYLIGHLDTRHHFTDEQSVVKEMGALIRDWKSKPNQLMMRFDLDRDGRIDMQEWEHAREQARVEVEQTQVNQAHVGEYEISAPSNGQLYLLSGMSPQVLRKRYRWWVWLHLFSLLVWLGISVIFKH